MTAPVFQAAGTASAHINDLTLSPPAHIADDIFLMCVVSSAVDAEPTLSTPAGFVRLTSVENSGVEGVFLTLFWCRATSSSMGSPTIADPGNHVGGQIVSFRGCITSGNPWDTVATAFQDTAGTTAIGPAITTSVVDCLLVSILARDNDVAGAGFSSWELGAGGPALTEQADVGTGLGDGSGFALATIDFLTPGTSPAPQAVVASSRHAAITLALKPPAAPPPADMGAFFAVL